VECGVGGGGGYALHCLALKSIYLPAYQRLMRSLLNEIKSNQILQSSPPFLPLLLLPPPLFPPHIQYTRYTRHTSFPPQPKDKLQLTTYYLLL
jgi:hypothetical protein